MMAFETPNEIDATLGVETNLLGVETAAVGDEINTLGVETTAVSDEINTLGVETTTTAVSVETAMLSAETATVGVETAKIGNPFEKMSPCAAKRRNGLPCKRIGNKRNGRCRLHGGNAGAPSGERNGRFRHGGETKEAQQQLRATRRLLLEAAKLIRRQS